MTALLPLTVICAKCGTAHLDVPGDTSTWRCRKCDAPLTR